VELGVSAAAGIDVDLRTLRTGARQQAVTEYILGLADRAGYRAALIDAALIAADPSAPLGTWHSLASGGTDPSVMTWSQFAHTVRAAVRGLSRRGLRESDTVGIFVHDAVRHVVAVHAVRAAGALAAPVRPAPVRLSPTTADAAGDVAGDIAGDIAAQLKGCRARLLITSAALAELAVEAAERSCVRQVFAFGEAEGTTPFGSLLHAAKHGQAQPADRAGQDGGAGRDGADGPGTARMPDLAWFGLDGPVPRLTSRDVVVAAPPCGDPDAYTSLLDLVLAAGATLVAAPLSQVGAAAVAYKGTAAIVPRGTDVPGLDPGRILAVG